MFRHKPQRLVQSHLFKTKTLSNPSFNYLQYLFFNKNIKTLAGYYKVPTYSFSSSQNPQRTVFQEEELPLLKNDVPSKELPRFTKIMKKYSKCKDLTDSEIQSVSLILNNLADAHERGANSPKAYRYLIEDEDLFMKAGIKDTFHRAENHYKRAMIDKFQRNWIQEENNLNETFRICQLLEDNPKARSLMLDCKCALAYLFWTQRTDFDRALSLYNSVLENIGDLSEKVLPDYLMEVHKMIGHIHSKKNDIDKAIDSWTKCLELAIKYYGENSNHAYTFYDHIATFLRQRGQSQRALPYAQKNVEVAPKVFSKDSIEVLYSHTMLGHVYLALKDDTQALNSYQKALEIYKVIYDKSPEYYYGVWIYREMEMIQVSIDDIAKRKQSNEKQNNIREK